MFAGLVNKFKGGGGGSRGTPLLSQPIVVQTPFPSQLQLTRVLVALVHSSLEVGTSLRPSIAVARPTQPMLRQHRLCPPTHLHGRAYRARQDTRGRATLRMIRLDGVPY